ALAQDGDGVIVGIHLQRQPDGAAVGEVVPVPAVAHVDELAGLGVDGQHIGHLRVEAFAGVVLGGIAHRLPAGQQVLAAVVGVGGAVPAVGAGGDHVVPAVVLKDSGRFAAGLAHDAAGPGDALPVAV